MAEKSKILHLLSQKLLSHRFEGIFTSTKSEARAQKFKIISQDLPDPITQNPTLQVRDIETSPITSEIPLIFQTKLANLQNSSTTLLVKSFTSFV